MNLQECRNKINDIDDKICDLFVERMKVSSEVAKAKIAANLAVTDNSREREERLRMIKRAGDELGDRAAVLFTECKIQSVFIISPIDYPIYCGFH